jgi:hypothetical protein
MTKDDLVKQVKTIVALARGGNLDEAYAGYRALFSDPGFLAQRPEDQRQALKLMVHAKVQVREPTPAMIEAHRAALMPLTELVSSWGEPVDHELLGTCHVLLGNLPRRPRHRARAQPRLGPVRRADEEDLAHLSEGAGGATRPLRLATWRPAGDHARQHCLRRIEEGAEQAASAW